MRFAICDDDVAQGQAMMHYLEQRNLPKLELVYFQQGKALVEEVTQGQRFDAVFLDMEMPEMNGIEVANCLRNVDRHIDIIFVTAHTIYMEESFKCAPFRFLIKPIQEEKLTEATNALYKKRIQLDRNRLVLKTKSALVSLYWDEIIYCMSEGHIIHIYTPTEQFAVRMTMAALMDQLGEECFGRPYNAYIVNFDYVKVVKGNEVVLRFQNQVIPMSRTYKKGFFEAYTNYLERSFCV